MTLDRYLKKKKDLPDTNGDLSLAIHPTIIASMNREVEATSVSTSGSVPGTTSSKRQPYNKVPAHTTLHFPLRHLLMCRNDYKLSARK